MALSIFYTMVQKGKKGPEIQVKGPPLITISLTTPGGSLVLKNH